MQSLAPCNGIPIKGIYVGAAADERIVAFEPELPDQSVRIYYVDRAELLTSFYGKLGLA